MIVSLLEKALSTLAAVGIPTIGLLLRASKRNRLRHRIDDYLALAERIEEHDPDDAVKLRGLAAEAVRMLVKGDERWLRRRFDPGALAALIFLTVPTAIVFVVALTTWHGWWKWLVVGVTAIWTLVWGGVGVTQLWTLVEDHDADPES